MQASFVFLNGIWYQIVKDPRVFFVQSFNDWTEQHYRAKTFSVVPQHFSRTVN